MIIKNKCSRCGSAIQSSVHIIGGVCDSEECNNDKMDLSKIGPDDPLMQTFASLRPSSIYDDPGQKKLIAHLVERNKTGTEPEPITYG